MVGQTARFVLVKLAERQRKASARAGVKGSEGEVACELAIAQGCDGTAEGLERIGDGRTVTEVNSATNVDALLVLLLWAVEHSLVTGLRSAGVERDYGSLARRTMTPERDSGRSLRCQRSDSWLTALLGKLRSRRCARFQTGQENGEAAKKARFSSGRAKAQDDGTTEAV